MRETVFSLGGGRPYEIRNCAKRFLVYIAGGMPDGNGNRDERFRRIRIFHNVHSSRLYIVSIL